jgi:hypothetical protein
LAFAGCPLFSPLFGEGLPKNRTQTKPIQNPFLKKLWRAQGEKTTKGAAK